MESTDESRAQAGSEDTSTTESATPSKTTETAESKTTTKEELDPQKAMDSGDLDGIRALMRASNGVLARPRDQWTDLGGDPTATKTSDNPAKSEKSETEAKPEEEETETAEEETQEEEGTEEQEEEEQEEPGKDKKAEEKKEPKKEEETKPKDHRVRTAKFSPDDRMIIAHMAQMDNPSIAAARAELIAAGRLQPSAEESQESATATGKAAAAAKTENPAAKAITAKQDEIVALEKQMEEAGTAFDTGKLAKLNIEHNKALRELTKLEAKAESDRSQAHANVQQQLQAAVSESESTAVEMFPDAGKEGTPLHSKIVELMKAAPAAAFLDPDYPVTFAAKAAAQIGHRPSAKADAKPALKIVPKKPAKPITPASGNSPSVTTKKSTADTRAQEALAGSDVEKLRASLREKGTRTLDA